MTLRYGRYGFEKQDHGPYRTADKPDDLDDAEFEATSESSKTTLGEKLALGWLLFVIATMLVAMVVFLPWWGSVAMLALLLTIFSCGYLISRSW